MTLEREQKTGEASESPPIAPEGTSVSSNTPQSQSSQPLDWNALLAQYGQAMARVGQLEEHNAILAKRLEALEKMEGDQEISGLLTQKEAELKQSNSTIASMRVQITSLSQELADVRQKLKLASEGNYARIKRRHRRRHWWQFWLRRHRH